MQIGEVIQEVALLGSTGSIGTQTLAVIAAHPERFRVTALAAGRNIALLAEQVQAFRPSLVSVADPADVPELRRRVPGYTGPILCGPEGLEAVATHARTVVVGLVGIIGLRPTLAALEAGCRVLTANKETFVAGGHLVARYLEQILPIDSEHSAIFQCLKQEPAHAVDRLILTASGGPFRTFTPAQLQQVTPEQALCHPNWVMGPKITVDSATLMNKGLEIIEAMWLFGVNEDRIDVWVHPQSIVHSGVAFVDGSVLFQAGTPDMRVPISVALGFPERLPLPDTRLTLSMVSNGLSFEPPDEARFPCLRLAREAARLGPAATVVLNAADEAAVARFLAGELSFMQIPAVIEHTLSQQPTLTGLPNLSEIEALDTWARQTVNQFGAVQLC